MTLIKLVVIGDGNVGKTCILVRFARETFEDTHTPTVFDSLTVGCVVDGTAVELQLWDTAGNC